VILVLDSYEVARLLDTWLRQDFVPALPATVHAILCGRDAPVAAWLSAPGWGGLLRTVAIEPLREADAVQLLLLGGLSEAHARQINRFTRGHPLALTLAAGLTTRHRTDLEALALHHVVEELARMYLAEVPDETTRQAIKAASVIRCVTISLLRAMIPAAVPQDLYERLRILPFVHQQRDGLQMHDSVQQAIALNLKAEDPTRYCSYRRAAWYQLRTEARTAPPPECWRYTADMLFLLENPYVREGFFPTGAHMHAVEPARPEDAGAIHEIARRWDGPEGLAILDLWLKHALHGFHVARDANRDVVAFYCAFGIESVHPALVDADPVVRRWLAHMQAAPIAPLQTVLLFRRLLCRDVGEQPCAAQGACWLDVKSAYMRLRPNLRRVYSAVSEAEFSLYWSALAQVGFEVGATDIAIDGRPIKTIVLDMGPLSVDGWLAGLVAAELGLSGRELLDKETRELVVDGSRVALTKLEFAVMRYLHEHEGSAVQRESLLRDVWNLQYNVGSNVVDVVIVNLRKRLGNQAGLIETVPGFGYRFLDIARPDSS
jgi:hypothetical protein